jgi:hypothetical protein
MCIAGQKKDKKERRAARKERKQGGVGAKPGASAASVRQPTAEELAAAGARLGPRAQAEQEEAARKAAEAAAAAAAAAEEDAHVSVSEDSGSDSDKDESALVQVLLVPMPSSFRSLLPRNDAVCAMPMSRPMEDNQWSVLACTWADACNCIACTVWVQSVLHHEFGKMCEGQASEFGACAMQGQASAEDAAEVAALLAEERVELLPEQERERLREVDALTGQPRPDDVLLFALPARACLLFVGPSRSLSAS